MRKRRDLILCKSLTDEESLRIATEAQGCCRKSLFYMALRRKCGFPARGLWPIPDTPAEESALLTVSPLEPRLLVGSRGLLGLQSQPTDGGAACPLCPQSGLWIAAGHWILEVCRDPGEGGGSNDYDIVR